MTWYNWLHDETVVDMSQQWLKYRKYRMGVEPDAHRAYFSQGDRSRPAAPDGRRFKSPMTARYERNQQPRRRDSRQGRQPRLTDRARDRQGADSPHVGPSRRSPGGYSAAARSTNDRRSARDDGRRSGRRGSGAGVGTSNRSSAGRPGVVGAVSTAHSHTEGEYDDLQTWYEIGAIITLLLTNPNQP